MPVTDQEALETFQFESGRNHSSSGIEPCYRLCGELAKEMRHEKSMIVCCLSGRGDNLQVKDRLEQRGGSKMEKDP